MRATASLVLLVTAATGLSSCRDVGTLRPVGSVTRQFVPPGAYDWRGATTHALVTTVWYPAAVDTTMSAHTLGPPDAPLFRLGDWSDGARPDEGRFPLLVLSHGTGGSAPIMAWLASSLASRGYVVAAVNHPGNNALEPYTAEGFLLWWERARDLSTVIDGLLADDELSPRIDADRIGAIGFSLGGHTVLSLAGGRTDPTLFWSFCQSAEAAGCADPPEFPDLFARWADLEATDPAFRHALSEAGRSYRDPRVRVVFAIAPALGPALTADSLRDISIPVEIIAGAEDSIVPIDSNARRVANLARTATLTIMPGAGHYTFLAPCTAAGRQAQRQLCNDAPGVDRESIHEQLIDAAVRFLAQLKRT